MRNSRFLATILIAGLAIGLSACGGDAEPAKETTKAASAKPSDAPSEDADDEKSADTKGDGASSDWAEPASIVGEKLSTIEGDGFTVDVYQVGTAAATETGYFVDSETDLPLINVGDEIVFVNYVITNTGSKSILLSNLLVEVDAEYADWPYMGGMDGIYDEDLYAEMGITEDVITEGAGDPPFRWEPGQAFSIAENFKYQAGSPITFTASLTPADKKGELVHDESQEVSVDTTIK